MKTKFVLGLMISLVTFISGCSVNIQKEEIQEQSKIKVEFIDDTIETEETTLSSWNNEKDYINILLIGQDRRSTSDREENARSDCMILVNINKESNTIKLISFMRDLYVEIPEHIANRINAAYRFGGVELLSDTLYKNFGIEVDGAIEVDFAGFEQIIDTIGGVEIDVTKDEIETINKCSLNEKEGLITEPGIHNLNGKQALAYARIRYIGNGDFERTERQRTILLEAAKKLKKLDIYQITKLYKPISNCIKTDISKKQMLELVLIGIKSNLSDVNTYNIPEDTGYTDKKIRGMAVLVPDLKKCNEFLIELEVN